VWLAFTKAPDQHALKEQTFPKSSDVRPQAGTQPSVMARIWWLWSQLGALSWQVLEILGGWGLAGGSRSLGACFGGAVFLSWAPFCLSVCLSLSLLPVHCEVSAPFEWLIPYWYSALTEGGHMTQIRSVLCKGCGHPLGAGRWVLGGFSSLMRGT
jgi:hypothetical protein